jgi:hypothetical protein
MTEFLQTALTFPTLAYSILLAFCVVYWLLAATGLFDADSIDGWLGGDGDGADATDTAGILARLGLGGVPVMLVLSVLAFFGWLCTYFVHLLVLQHLPGGLRLLAGLATAGAALVPGVLAASLLLRPVARLMARLRPPAQASVLGRAGTVITPHVDQHGGRAGFDDGGAGLILQVRSAPGTTFMRGERVVLISHDEPANTYTVMSETEFNNR